MRHLRPREGSLNNVSSLAGFPAADNVGVAVGTNESIKTEPARVGGEDQCECGCIAQIVESAVTMVDPVFAERRRPPLQTGELRTRRQLSKRRTRPLVNSGMQSK